jgi:hypothetical protein
MIVSSTHVTLSTISPLGTSEENRKLRCMALIPPKESGVGRHEISSNLRQMGYSAGRRNPSFRLRRCASG